MMVATQFHPEMMTPKDQSATRLFDAFIAAAQKKLKKIIAKLHTLGVELLLCYISSL